MPGTPPILQYGEMFADYRLREVVVPCRTASLSDGLPEHSIAVDAAGARLPISDLS